MGKLEEASRKRKKKKDIQSAVLAVVAVTGFLAFAAVAGNAIQLLEYLPNEKYNLKYRMKSVAGRLAAKGDVEGVEKEKVDLKNKKKKWDGRWRMVVFDIPERRSHIRARLRAVMCEIGFVRLQDSVWVYPYDCEDFIALLKAELKIGKDVLYAIVDTIEHDKGLRLQFKLPEA